MAIPLYYSFRNLWTRRLTTVLTVFGMSLVVFVFASILMLSEGLKKTLVQTGLYDNALVIRKGAKSEVQSSIDRIQASIVDVQPEIAIDDDGHRLIAKEVVVLISLPKKGTNKPSNVTIRGVSAMSFRLRPQLKVVEGRLPKAGSSEIIVGQSISRRFEGCNIGDRLRFAMREWTIVGVFDAGNTGFSSEIWSDAEQLMQAFRRPLYSSVVLRLKEPSEIGRLKNRLESEPRLTVDIFRETQYYEEQSEIMATFLRILGMSVTIIFSIGAVIGAMITMYAAVANRVGEIGTMRALGFQRKDILIAFLVESLLFGLIGGFIGLFFASLLQFFTVSTMNFQTFSELAFTFTLTFQIVCQAMAFSLVMGLVGGLLPAYRASRLNIIEALNAE